MRITQLSKFCDGLMEAGWLAALILVPSFYNLFSSRIFEPDKIALLRTLALIVLLAWLVKLGETNSWKYPTLRPWREWTFQRLPFFWPVVLLLAANLIATALSVTPHLSIWGSYDRGEGLYTWLAYVTFFIVIAANVRRREQIERVLTTIILTAFALSLYGLIQKLNLDPLPWDVQTATRVSGNLGNAIFFAAYLILVVPLTVLRFLNAIQTLLRREAAPLRPSLEVFLYLVILVAQLAAIYYSGSRGPWLGLLVGLLGSALLFSLLLKRRWATVSILGLAALGLAFIGLLNVPNGPLEGLRSNAYIGRLGHVFEDEDDTSRVRVLIWQGASQMALPHAPLTYANGTPDALNFLRPLIGYGPESTGVAFHYFYSPEIAHYEKRDATPDRSHNATFDALITTGLLGLLAYLGLFISTIYLGLNWLGLITRKDLWPYLISLAVGALIGAIGLVIWRSPAYFGVGLPLGLLVGLFAYLAFITLTRSLSPIDPCRAGLIIALLGGLLAHFVEVQFGIPIAATQLHAWVFTGLLIVVGWGMVQPVEPVKAKAQPEVQASASWMRTAVLASSLVGILLVTLSYNFLTVPNAPKNLVDVIWASVTTVYRQPNLTAYVIPILFALCWVVGVALLTNHWRSFGLTLGLSLLVWLAFTVYQGSLLSLISNRINDDPTVTTAMPIALNLLPGFGLWVIALLIAFTLTQSIRLPNLTSTPVVRWLASGVAFIVVLGLALFFNLQPIQADEANKVANNFAARHDWATAIPLYRQALGFAPEDEHYYLLLAQAQIAQAQTLADRTQRLNELKLAIRNFNTAQRLNPLLPSLAVGLAQASQLVAQTSTDAAEATTYLNDADSYYEQATRLAPNNTDYWNGWARLNLIVRGDKAAALQKIQTSLTVDSAYGVTYALFGDYWAVLGNGESNETIQQSDYQRAADNYYQALELQPNGTSLTARSSLGQVETALKHYDAALAIYDDLLQRAPDAPDVWLVYNALGKIYLAQGNKVKALENAYLSLNFAPNQASKDKAQAFINAINATTP